jgi:hypothetical protein
VNIALRLASAPFAAACALIALNPLNAFAADKFDGFFFMSGQELDQMCRSQISSEQRACATYVCGMVDGWQTEEIVNHKKPFQYCLRVGTTCQELGASIPKYLDQNPKARQSAAGGVVASALVKTYGCN